MTTSWKKIVERQLVADLWNFYHGQHLPLQIRTIQAKFSEWLETSHNKIMAKVVHVQTARDPHVHDFNTFKSQFFEKLRAVIYQRITQAKISQDAHYEIEALDLQARINELESHFANKASDFFRVVHECLSFEKELLAKTEPVVPAMEPHVIPCQQQPGPSSSTQFTSNTDQQFIFRVDKEISDLKIKYDELVMETNAVWTMENALHTPPYGFDYVVELRQQVHKTIYGCRLIINQFSHVSTMNNLLKLQKEALNYKAHMFADLAQHTFGKLDGQVEQISYLLKAWAVDQRHVLNGSTPAVSMVGIGNLTDTVAKGLLDLYKILKDYNSQGVLIDELIKWLDKLQCDTQDRAKKLIRETFIVQEQPKQILLLRSKVKNSLKVQKPNKLETGMKVRLLVGTTFKCCETPIVVASLISRPEANKVFDDQTQPFDDQTKTRTYHLPTPAMDLLYPDNTRMMELDERNNMFIANFAEIEMPKSRNTDSPKDSKLKGKGPKKLKDDRVPLRKYYFHFRTHYSCPDLDITNLNIFTTSVPVIANTHTNKKEDSWAAILWDNASAELGKSPFEVKMEIGCSDLVETFSNLFHRDTGRPLSLRNKEFLATKLMSCPSKGTGNTVTWEMFFGKEMKIDCLRPESCPQNDSSDTESEVESKPKKVNAVTFHSWFYEAKQFCTPSPRNKTGIPRFWREGKIEGFISKDDLKKILMQKQGRFALYFSEALLGGLTVAWYNFDMVDPALQRLSPFTPNTFVENKELERRLHDQKQLYCLYQEQRDDELKEIAFPFPVADSERVTPIQREINKRNKGSKWREYIQTLQETRNIEPILT